MSAYTRKQLKERWEKTKAANRDPDSHIDGIYWTAIHTIREEYIPGVWEVRIFPRWIFKNFLDRKIIESPDSAIMSRNVSYDADSEETQEWGWYRWMYIVDEKEDCHILELDYNIDVIDKKALPLVRGILDICLLENANSIIGKFKWRIRWLQRIPLLRRIPPIFLFYFEMKKIAFDYSAMSEISDHRIFKSHSDPEGKCPQRYNREYLERVYLRPMFDWPEDE